MKRAALVCLLTVLSASMSTGMSTGATGEKTPIGDLTELAGTVEVKTDSVAADFARFRKELAAAEPEEQERLTSEFVDQVGSTPAVAGSTVIFLAEGQGSGPVRLFGDFNAWARYKTGTSLDRGQMTPLEQSGWFFRELELDPEARIEYLFADNKQEPWLDPNNPTQTQSFDVRHSELRMPGYARRRDWRDSSDALKGSLESFEVTSELLGNTRQVSVYLPPIENAADAGLPVLFVNDGSLYRELGFHWIVDTLIAEGSIRPIAVVMVDPVDRNPEYRDDPNFNRFFAQELQEVLSARYKFSVEPAERGVVGGSRGGLGALIACWRHPEVFGLCGLLSPAVTPVAILDEIYVEPVKPLRIFLTGGLYDLRWYGDYLRVRDTLLYRGYDLTYRVMPEGHTPNAWLTYLPDLLVEFFGP
jgi:enterochelin esterase-like enzyme